MSTGNRMRHEPADQTKRAVGLVPGLYQPLELPKITKEVKEKSTRPKMSKIDKESLSFQGDTDLVFQKIFGLPKKKTVLEASRHKLTSRRQSKIPVFTKPQKRVPLDQNHSRSTGRRQTGGKSDVVIPGSYGTARMQVHRQRDTAKPIPRLVFTSEPDIPDDQPGSRAPSASGSIVSDWPVLPYTRTTLKEPTKTALKVDVDSIVLDRFNITKGEEELKTELRMIMFGNSGSGKSMAANMIVGDNSYKAFAKEESSAHKSVRYENVRFGHKLLLVEIPGFFDAVMEHNKMIKEMTRCVGLTSPGLHAFVFVLDGFLFTKQEQTTLHKFAQIFGEDMYSFLIILFTHKDIMEYSGLTLDAYITKGSSMLKKLLNQCGNRYISFNNFARDEDAITQASGLIDLVIKLKENNGGKSYTSDMFQEAERSIRNQIKEKEFLIKHEYAIRLKTIDEKYELIMAEEKIKQDKIVKNLYEQMKHIRENEYQQEKDLEWIMELQEMQIMYNDIHETEKASKIGDQIIKLIAENKKQIEKNKELQQKKDYSDLLFSESEEKLAQLMFRRELLLTRNEQEYVEERSKFRENIRLQCQIEEAGFFKRLQNSIIKFIDFVKISDE